MSLYFQAKYQLRFLWGLTAAALGFHSSILTGGGGGERDEGQEEALGSSRGSMGAPCGDGVGTG